ncbi:MAG: FimV/HubP family polar landmark protein, partial [Rhodanobacteraceae bacterium]
PQPRPQPQPQAQNQTQVAPAPPPSRPASTAGGQIPVQRGDTLYRLAKDASQGTGTSINQMMLALKSANPEAFFKNNINDLKAGAILRIPTRDEIDRTGVAEANAEVHRQYEAWRAAKLRRVTVVAGSAAHAAARTAPQPASAAPASDHLELVPPTGAGKGTGSRPGVANGTGTETVAGLQQQLQNEQGTLASLNQSNTDLESRVRSLQDIAGKSDKLLSLKDATIAELQRKLAAVQSGKPVAAVPVSAAAGDAAKVDRPASGAQAVKPAAKAAAAKPRGPGISWFQRPLTWIVAGLIVLALILIGLLGRRRRGRAAPAQAPGPLPDPVDVTPRAGTAAYAASLQARLAEDPGDLGAHLALCRLYHAQSDVERFVAAAEAMHAHVPDSGCMEWHEVAVMGEELAPGDPLFAALADTQAVQSQEDPSGVATLHEPVDAEAAEDQPPEAAAATAPDPDLEPVEEALHAPPVLVDVAAEPQPAPVLDPEADPNFYDDPVDTKLDLARAYLDMGDPDGARAMLDEVLEEGSQMQKSEAKRLLVEASV